MRSALISLALSSAALGGWVLAAAIAPSAPVGNVVVFEVSASAVDAQPLGTAADATRASRVVGGFAPIAPPSH